LEWRLAELFCEGVNAHKACERLDIAYRTAWTHYMKFEAAIRKLISVEESVFISYKAIHDAINIIFILDRKMPMPPEYQNTAMRLIFLTLIKSGVPKKNPLEEREDFLMVS
jgi:hypothetical protein